MTFNRALWSLLSVLLMSTVSLHAAHTIKPSKWLAYGAVLGYASFAWHIKDKFGPQIGAFFVQQQEEVKKETRSLVEGSKEILAGLKEDVGKTVYAVRSKLTKAHAQPQNVRAESIPGIFTSVTPQ